MIGEKWHESILSKVFWDRYASKVAKKEIKDRWFKNLLDISNCIMSKGQFIWKVHFDVFKSTKKKNNILLRISALASKKMLNHKDNGTLLC